MTNFTDDIRLDADKNPINYYGHTVGPDGLNERDQRQELYRKQRDERGFDNTELWSLDMTIIRFMIPRLEAFAKDQYGVPYGLTEDEWVAKLNQFISDCKVLLDFSCEHNKQEDARKRFFDFIQNYFFALWN